ncbi:pentapeptide repeat-containing protein [Crocosphaera sp. XPORK-15E]|uniref:pentapeptide repeat-containing protein n=1 Tax=Crocosphaera sp. XPORK-15E TaxID=3110247 RepID=UPI002B20DCCF|nr:pentapeptide repeat-containing protein [Crocosphaera sp. XPORK-15E]MEA5532939.1 pentapeptide repeat-containing protein [Crocosphaera sp. XPORK-15E]
MSDFCPSLHPLLSYSPYPSCVFLKLEAGTPQTTAEPFTLTLTLRCDEQEKALLNGHLKFGIKGGKLTLTVENGEIIAPQSLLNDFCQLVSTSNTVATWQLIPQTGQSMFTVEMVSSLAKIQVMTHPVSVILTCDVSLADISITDVVGLWKHDIHPNKQSILERKLAQFLWKFRLSPHLSLLKLTSDLAASEKVEESSTTTIDPNALSQLHQQIDRIYNAETNNFLELAQIAELDPLQDLAGGNFLATELSGIELSGANLTQSNFRGANLTDADLSEAVLNYARFSGADLSGAYLGNANLQQGDFYRASLALANLIGADLTDANLQEVNLSQTNLSGAVVKGAKFGNNTGMTEELADSLRERGAIFVGDS